MKFNYLFAISATLITYGTLPLVSKAQDYTDAERIQRNEYHGTARFQAMGGAFSALGADLSSATVNPAGIACYRATECAISTGANINVTNNNYYGFTHKDNNVKVPFNQLGAVISTNLIRENARGIVGHDFGINFTKIADYNNESNIHRYNSKSSLLDFFCTPDGTTDYAGNLAYDAEMIDDSFVDTLIYDDGTKKPITINDCTHSYWEMPYYSPDDDQVIFPYEMRENMIHQGLIDIDHSVRERGHKGETTFSYGQNIQHTVYWGVSIGIQNYYYSKETTHIEHYTGVPDLGAPNYFKYTTKLTQNGAGLNFKAGVIYRPIPQIRIGAVVHSPTFFSIDETYETTFRAGTENIHKSPYLDTDYKMRTSGSFIGSIAGVIGQIAIVSAEYERTGYQRAKFSSRFSDDQSVLESVNENVKGALQGTNTLRIGAEIKPLSLLAVRGGYQMQSSPFKDSIIKHDYKNRTFSAGIGLRISNFFADFTYVNQKTSNEYWGVLPDAGDQYLYEEASNYNGKNPGTVDAAYMSKINHRAVVTVGFRF